MTNTITAAEILERFKAGQTDFTDLGECEVHGKLTLGRLKITEVVDLGELHFKKEVRLSQAEFSPDAPTPFASPVGSGP